MKYALPIYTHPRACFIALPVLPQRIIEPSKSATKGEDWPMCARHVIVDDKRIFRCFKVANTTPDALAKFVRSPRRPIR